MPITIQKFSKESIRASRLNEAINLALAPIAAQFGLTARYAGGKFDDASFTAKVEFKINDPAAVTAAEKKVWDQFCGLFGFTPDQFGMEFSDAGSGDRFRIAGLNPGRPKNCVKITRLSDNSGRICPPDFVLRRLQQVAAHAAT